MFYFLNFYVHGWVFFLRVCLHHMHTVPLEARKAIRFPGSGVKTVVSTLWVLGMEYKSSEIYKRAHTIKQTLGGDITLRGEKA